MQLAVMLTRSLRSRHVDVIASSLLFGQIARDDDNDGSVFFFSCVPCVNRSYGQEKKEEKNTQAAFSGGTGPAHVT